MRTFKILGIILFIVILGLNFVSCDGNSKKTQEGQKALDIAVEKHGNAAALEYHYLEGREYYKRQGDQKNADYYDKKAKEQSKEVERLRQEREKIREETYGNVWK